MRVIFVWLIFLMSLALQGFTLINETDYQVNIRVYQRSWWTTSKFELSPRDKKIHYYEHFPENTFLYFELELVDPIEKKPIGRMWKIHAESKSTMDIKLANDDIILHVNKQLIV